MSLARIRIPKDSLKITVPVTDIINFHKYEANRSPDVLCDVKHGEKLKKCSILAVANSDGKLDEIIRLKRPKATVFNESDLTEEPLVDEKDKKEDPKAIQAKKVKAVKQSTHNKTKAIIEMYKKHREEEDERDNQRNTKPSGTRHDKGETSTDKKKSSGTRHNKGETSTDKKKSSATRHDKGETSTDKKKSSATRDNKGRTSKNDTKTTERIECDPGSTSKHNQKFTKKTQLPSKKRPLEIVDFEECKKPRYDKQHADKPNFDMELVQKKTDYGLSALISSDDENYQKIPPVLSDITNISENKISNSSDEENSSVTMDNHSTKVKSEQFKSLRDEKTILKKQLNDCTEINKDDFYDLGNGHLVPKSIIRKARRASQPASYVIELANALYGREVLASSCVESESGVEKPELCSEKMEAIVNSFKNWLISEKYAPDLVDYEVKRVNYYLKRAIKGAIRQIETEKTKKK